MEGRLTQVQGLAPDELAAWRSLAERAVEANPMNEVDFVVPAARHQPGGSAIELATATDGDRLYGAVPVRPIGRHGSICVPMLTTNVRRMTYLGSPLLDASCPLEAAQAVLKGLAARRQGLRRRILVIQWMGDDGPLAEALRRGAEGLGFPVHGYERFDQPALLRRPDGDYAALQTKRHRKDYERRARRLEDLLGAKLEVVNRAGERDAVDTYIGLEAAGYKRDIGVAMTTRAGETEFFHDMCRRFAAAGRLHFLELRAGGRTVAQQVSVEAGDTLFLVKVGHDEAFARYDPGVQLHLRAMEYFHHETSAKAIRVCTFPDNELLLRLYPDRLATSTWLIGLGGGLNGAIVRALPGARRISANLRRIAAAPSAPEAARKAG